MCCTTLQMHMWTLKALPLPRLSLMQRDTDVYGLQDHRVESIHVFYMNRSFGFRSTQKDDTSSEVREPGL